MFSQQTSLQESAHTVPVAFTKAARQEHECRTKAGCQVCGWALESV